MMTAGSFLGQTWLLVSKSYSLLLGSLGQYDTISWKATSLPRHCPPKGEEGQGTCRTGTSGSAQSLVLAPLVPGRS